MFIFFSHQFVIQAGIPDPPAMTEALIEQKTRERRFLEQLLDGSKLDSYKVPVPIMAELRKYQQVSVQYHKAIIIIIIAAFKMHKFPSSGCSSRNILLLPRWLDTISRPHVQCTISTPRGAFLAELPIMAFTGNCILIYLSHPIGSPFIHLSGKQPCE